MSQAHLVQAQVALVVVALIEQPQELWLTIERLEWVGLGADRTLAPRETGKKSIEVLVECESWKGRVCEE